MTTTAPELTDAERFRARRLELDLTLEEVARRADVALSTVIRLEQGRAPQGAAETPLPRNRPAARKVRAILWPDTE